MQPIKKRFGLLGRNINYSFSKGYFTDKFEKEKLEYQQALKDVEAGIVLELDEDYWKNIDKYIEK